MNILNKFQKDKTVGSLKSKFWESISTYENPNHIINKIVRTIAIFFKILLFSFCNYIINEFCEKVKYFFKYNFNFAQIFGEVRRITSNYGKDCEKFHNLFLFIYDLFSHRLHK